MNKALLNDNRMLSSSEIEEQLFSDFKRNKSVTALELPFSATSIVVPKMPRSAAYTVSMIDRGNSDKLILYKAMISAYNYAFLDKSAAVSAKHIFSSVAKSFIEWLNFHNIGNRYELLRCYETERMDELGNHGGSSPLIRLNNVLGYAIGSEALITELSNEDYAFLIKLKNTKPVPNLNRTQKSISSYFGALDWLRREDIGIGRDLYSALGSPKLVVNSLSLTSATVITELKAYKDELKQLLKSIEPQLIPLFELEVKNLSNTRKSLLIGNVIYLIISAYHNLETPSVTLKSAIAFLLLANASNKKCYFNLLKILDSQSNCDNFFLNKKGDKTKINSTFCMWNFTTLLSGDFSISALKALISNVTSQTITNIEMVMFAWLMASLTVQPTDIPKLTHRDFRLMKVGGKVTHIECEYFKGRAKVFHTTRSLSIRTPEGKALLAMMEQQIEGNPFYVKSELSIGSGSHSLLGRINLLLQSSGMSAMLKATHMKINLPNLIPPALCALISNGVNVQNCIENPCKITLKERCKLVKQSRSPCSKKIFGLQAIKNSAVHAFSDPYTLEYLINRNSHTNITEKINYLTEDNEEWINSSGRITREVMLDLIQNVFNLGIGEDETQLKKFNSEFMAVTESISYKHEEMNSRLRLVTGQEKGKVNEVGILALSRQNEITPLSPIYVVDNPITVLKMYNYLHEFKKNYKKLLTHNPEFLFKTAIPTVEWLEDTLGKLSKLSQQKGREQFDEMIKNGVVVSVFHSL